MPQVLVLSIIIPLISGIAVLSVNKKFQGVKEALTLLSATVSLLIAVSIFNKEAIFTMPWAGFGIDFSLRLYQFNAFILLAVSFFALLVSLYSTVFMYQKPNLNQFYAYILISLAFVNGAVLSDNLLLLLFFWEGLLLTLFAMIAINNKGAFKTAAKAFIIEGAAGLCMTVGIGLSAYLAGTLTISKINLSLNGLGGLAFILLMIGAISKAGAMPFHSWIPDAAVDASLPFMALLPASIDKLLGIYLLARISLDMFKLDGSSWISILLMIIGIVTIVLAVMMALVQKDFKKLLSYHAISQVGYMILGIGTCLPAGIIGGLFHMINNALYKSCLFFTGGSIEKQSGSTNLEKLGGLYAKMPVTFICFLIAAASISGVPPFNGFFSKELIYDAALERGIVFYIAAIAGSFFTAASFLKLGHSAFLGKLNESNKDVKEAKWPMLVPMITIASVCIFFGLNNNFPLAKFIQPVLGQARLGEYNFSGWPANAALIIITALVLVAAFIHHVFGARVTGGALHAADHIRYSPLLSGIYTQAEKKRLDPYEIGLKVTKFVARLAYWFDRKIDWIYDTFFVGIANGFSLGLKWLHNGNYVIYIIWSILGSAIAIIFMVK